jgi:hypothetical protein
MLHGSGSTPRASRFLPKRWIVEWTLAWISSRNCRLAPDFERYAVAAFVRLAIFRVMPSAHQKYLVMN